MTESTNTQQQEPFRILLIGDNCVDRYMIGVVERLSPEAPVPIFNIKDSYDKVGMSANVRENLINLNCDVTFVTNKGNIVKTRFIDQKSGQHLLRVDHDDPEVEPWDGTIGEFPWDIYHAVVVSDYNKGFLTYESIEQIIKSAGCPVFIDTKKQDLSRFGAPHVYVKINELEYKNRYSIPQNLIVTLGERGSMLKQLGSEDKTYKTIQVEVSDVCGAGDTFLAALTHQYLLTQNIKIAIMFANTAAGITVQHRGNYAPTYDEIRIAGY